MIDSHCHLTAPQFDTDRDTVIERARQAGVSPIVTISDEIGDLPKCQALCKRHNDLFYSAGVHPHHAKTWRPEFLDLIRTATQDPKCCAIGEIGLDYHYDFSPRDMQQKVFEAQLALAKELNLPAVVHCREAVEDVWAIVNHVKPQQLVIHCCTERWEDVKRFVEAGYFLSFTGIATYPKSDDVRETIKHCPISQLMVETDAPFLAPIPHRGKRCEPAYVLEVAKCVAMVKGLSVEEVDRVTSENAVQFFGLRL